MTCIHVVTYLRLYEIIRLSDILINLIRCFIAVYKCMLQIVQENSKNPVEFDIKLYIRLPKVAKKDNSDIHRDQCLVYFILKCLPTQNQNSGKRCCCPF